MGSVTLVGLGAMGSALAKALVKGGHTTTVWNRTQSKTDAAVSIGAIDATSVVKAVDANDLLLVCMSNYSATRSIFDTDEVRSHLTGKTLVQMGTGTPGEARDNEYWMREMGGDYLDVTIQPYPEGIGESDSRFLIPDQKRPTK
jgi:3-hydroxyisobutyrate dehydrogenase-like beta-hydroxyacid dehydrogenase